MLRVLVLLCLFFVGPAASADSCSACMSECPHATRDLKPCDRGCPEACGAKEEEPSPVAKCESCLSHCPHATRDLKPCDRGCPAVCDRETLLGVVLKMKESLQACDAREPSSAKAKAKNKHK